MVSRLKSVSGCCGTTGHIEQETNHVRAKYSIQIRKPVKWRIQWEIRHKFGVFRLALTYTNVI